MIEKDIETVVKAKVANVLSGLERVKIQGSWDVVASGEVKGREEPQFDAFAGVAVSPRSYETFSTPVANFAIAVSLAVRADRDPTGENFQAAVAALLELLHAWQRSVVAVRADFAVEGFAPHGARIDGGNAPDFDGGDNARWLFSDTFTVRGIISTTT